MTVAIRKSFLFCFEALSFGFNFGCVAISRARRRIGHGLGNKTRMFGDGLTAAALAAASAMDES